ncbi:MAG: lytic polysaccharide monooxygenase [Bdellovibrionales bacterium]|nr:lytic polysaccharide monooxygenase [Bdellovibrionales bacterium]
MLELVISLLLSSFEVHAHANLKADGFIPPRSSATGLKTGPCGNVPRTANPKVIAAGSTVTVEWIETINHPGRFEFYLSQAGDSNFQLLKTVQDDQNTSVVNGNFHMYSTQLTFPAGVTCTDCTLQMIQVMTENPANPSNYYSCADLRLQAASVPTPSPMPSPSPNPGNSCPP